MHITDNGDDGLCITTIGPHQWLILLIGVLVLFADGFDAQMVGYVAPTLKGAWGIQTAAFAPVFAANVAGLMVGSMIIPMFADVLGRKKLIIGCVAVFGVTSLATTLVSNITQLGTVRLLSGLALGGAMPCMIASGADYFPARVRTRLAVLMSTAWSLGITVCGLVTGAIVEARGWRSLFLIGGALPLMLTPILYFVLPESPAYLIAKGRIDVLRATLRRVSPDAVFTPQPASTPLPRFPLAALFQGELARITTFLWLAYVCAGVAIYFFLQWLPIFVKDAGYPASQAAYVGSLYQIGGLLGGIAISLLVDRWGPVALTGSLAAASLSIAGLGLAASSLSLMAVCAAVTGFLVVGSQNTSNAYTGSRLYPSQIRATGLGWALGVLRLSGVLAGSFAAGALLSLDLGPVVTLRVIAVPELLAGLAFLGVTLSMAQSLRAKSKEIA